MDDDNYQKLRDYALKLLSFRPRATREIYQKLKTYSAKKKFPDTLIDKVIDQLTQHKFLDDREFVRWWIDQRHSFRPKGIKIIKLELLNKGIDKEVINATVEESAEEKVSEYDLAMKVIDKKLVFLKGLSREKMQIKVRDLLFRRGFDWDTIRKVIDSLTGKSYNRE